VVATASGASRTETATITAAGSAGLTQTSSLPVSAVITAAGGLVVPVSYGTGNAGNRFAQTGGAKHINGATGASSNGVGVSGRSSHAPSGSLTDYSEGAYSGEAYGGSGFVASGNAGLALAGSGRSGRG
jgi:hypothetical protein